MLDSVTGLPAFILGNGPTLPKNLSCLDGSFTVGVNRILRSGFCPTVILWVDGTAYRDDGPAMDSSGSMLVCDASIASRQFHVGLKTQVGDAALAHPSTPTQLCCNGNTGCCAARWAAALGGDPVYLVGMSATYTEKTDFYGDNRWHHKAEEGCTSSTLHLMGSELQRLLRSGNYRPVVDGEHLRQIVKGPRHSQADLRRAVSETLRRESSNCQ